MRLSVTQAQEMAERVYEDRRDKLGYQEFDHVRRVADVVSVDSRAVALLHDTVEDDLYSFRQLYPLLSIDQFEALLLLTRDGKQTYQQYIRSIRDADGPGGVMAREIKRADLEDNMSRDCPEGMRGMSEPGGRYDRARKLLEVA